MPTTSLQTSKAHQRLIRETHEQEPEFFLDDKRELAHDLVGRLPKTLNEKTGVPMSEQGGK